MGARVRDLTARRRVVAAIAVLVTVVAGVVVAGTVRGTASAEAGQVPAGDPACGPAWVTAWQTSPQPGPEAAAAGGRFGGRTLRMVLRPQSTGSEIRVRLSNRYGQVPLVVAAASAATTGTGAGTRGGAPRPVLFDGRAEVTIPAGAEIVSDPVPFVAQAGLPVSVSVFLPREPDRVATHPLALQTSWVSAPGNHVDSTSGAAFGTPVTAWFVVTGLDVLVPRAEHAVVLVGDSITDGLGSDPDENDRWSDALSARLATEGGAAQMSVLNAGISGNQLLADAFGVGDSPATRFRFDVAAAAGVTDVVLHIGTNDIAEGRAADQIEAGLVHFADQARAAGLRVFLTTITPSRTGPRGTAAGQATRTAVNAWVLGQGPAHSDGVFDFAAAVADPARPDRLAPAYDSGDGLHLSAAGYRALAGAVRTDALAGSPCLAGDAASSVVVSGGR
ncbi:GDSL-type esterase/lipase family protein [Pseudonocardia dioxanivorans]|uniref:GDSL-type esterase/lipase family protein n=1 Tax=Pseudonocardia dioxanivorans TaxID=240495 RepID=UPI001047F300|nr:GDSL-type esterase/lipase family protein [Pseudonocardia dioxanivorans]